ncbi:Dna2/Cas4 domain-containing protein [Compostibacter hankyongensis]|uniref:CRISPR-associated protein Cas4 n=1 Tax=Compostibacter hankyongensis TaxID=1007089 RepID=A0ABP8G5U9_9BACT
MTLNATLINLYHVCPRECWLHANGIRMETTSEIVADGKLLHEISYPQRPGKYTEIELSSTFHEIELMGKIDFYDAKEKVIHEIKRSDKAEVAHEWQAKFYIWLLELNSIAGARAVLEYPKLRQTSEVTLSIPDKTYLQEVIYKITRCAING